MQLKEVTVELGRGMDNKIMARVVGHQTGQPGRDLLNGRTTTDMEDAKRKVRVYFAVHYPTVKEVKFIRWVE